MPEHMAVKLNGRSGTRFVRNFDVLEHIDPGPDSYVDLRYEDHKNPEYVRVSAVNHHPDKTIQAFFYTLHASGGRFIPGGKAGRTIKARLKPSETTLIHFQEKKHNSQLFMFNASFVEGE